MASVEAEDALRKAFAERLRAEMERRRISHRRLAERIETSKQSVTNWTQGRHEPSLRYLRRISAVLDIPVARLLEEETNRAPDPRAAETVVRDLADLGLRHSVATLRDSAPGLLDVLDRAERHVRNRRAAEQPER